MQSLKLFTIDICDKYFFVQLGKKVDKNFSVFLKRKKKRHWEDEIVLYIGIYM